MSEQHRREEFEERLRSLLARTAEAIPATTDLSARVRQAHTQGTRRAGGSVGSRHVLATIAAMLVVALLAGVLTFVRPGGPLRPAGGVTGGPTTTATAARPVVVVPRTCPRDPGSGSGSSPTSPPPPAGTPVDHSVAIGRHATMHGITITLDRAYADATQTVITYHMQTNLNPPLPDLPVLLDTQGHRYFSIGGDWDIRSGGKVVFTPLPPEELGTPQTLTFFTQQMRTADPTGPGTLVDGPWQIPVSLTPTAGTSIPLSTAPVAHSGLTIQPLRLDVAPAGGGLDGATGGARVVLRLSGLAPGMHVSDLPGIDTVEHPLGVGETSCGGGTLVLVLPNGQQIEPGFIALLGYRVPISQAEQHQTLAQTVGPNGTVDLAALFYAPIPAGASTILYLNKVQAQVAGAPKSTFIQGPWQFQLPPTA